MDDPNEYAPGMCCSPIRRLPSPILSLHYYRPTIFLGNNPTSFVVILS